MDDTPAKPRSCWRTAVAIFAASVTIAVLSGILVSEWIRRKGRGNCETASSNARSLSCAFFTFQDDYGSYPCEATAKMVRDNHPDSTAKLDRASSNDFFRQLIAAGTVDQEIPFYVPILDSRKPDNVLTGDQMLGKGEVGFAYMISHAACQAKDFPLILTPLVKGKLLFDPKCFDGKAVILYTDYRYGSRTIYPVDKDGHVWINGKDFFDPSQPYWHGIAPKVAWPE